MLPNTDMAPVSRLQPLQMESGEGESKFDGDTDKVTSTHRAKKRRCSLVGLDAR